MNSLDKEASASIGPPPPAWLVGGLGDTDGDGQSDNIWRDTESSETIVWRIDTLAEAAAQAVGTVPLI
jgi:hypothetical protein